MRVMQPCDKASSARVQPAAEVGARGLRGNRDGARVPGQLLGGHGLPGAVFAQRAQVKSTTVPETPADRGSVRPPDGSLEWGHPGGGSPKYTTARGTAGRKDGKRVPPPPEKDQSTCTF